MRRHQGFTLIEVLVAMTILALMMAMTWTTTSTSATSKKRFEAIQERNQEIRVAMTIMAKDLSSAYLSKNELGGQDNPRTLFVGKSERPVDELRFSSLGHRTLWENANESEQTLISYFTARDPDDSQKTNLLRRESRRLSNEPWESEPAEVDLLLRDVERVELEYYDWKDDEWQDHWDTKSADGESGRLPERVRIVVTVKNDRDDEIKHTTQARIMMQEQLNFL